MDYHAEDFVWNEGNCICGREIETWIDRRRNRHVGEIVVNGRVVDDSRHAIDKRTL
jgi:hypothetical protein